MKSLQEIQNQITKDLPGVTLKIVQSSLLIEKSADLPKVAEYLKNSSELKLNYLSSVTGSDYLSYLESVYHFYSMEKKEVSLTLRVRTDRKNPKIPSLVSLYRGAEFQEREAYDMYGILYEGHPDLRRLFMWEGFEGYPMRKDYQQEDSESLEEADIEWLKKRGIETPSDCIQQKPEDTQEKLQ